MTKIRKSWEQECNEVHSPEGVKELRRALKFGLRKKYYGLAESMFRYDGMYDDERFSDMLIMSQDTVPEQYLFNNGQCVWFEYANQIHCLPVVWDGGINIYGKMNKWHPMPIGWSDKPGANNSDVAVSIRMLDLDAANSVIMKNDIMGGLDRDIIDAYIDELVDNTLTMNQLQLIAKAPFVFNVTEDNLPNAKLFFSQMANDRPAIFVNRLGESPMPVIESTQMQIDPSLFELFDRFECGLLEVLGFPCVPITKRAQQTVSEVQSNDDKIYLKRMEKLHQREQAVDRLNKMFGTNITVVSVIDEQNEKDMEAMEAEAQMGQGSQKSGGDEE